MHVFIINVNWAKKQRTYGLLSLIHGCFSSCFFFFVARKLIVVCLCLNKNPFRYSRKQKKYIKKLGWLSTLIFFVFFYVSLYTRLCKDVNRRFDSQLTNMHFHTVMFNVGKLFKEKPLVPWVTHKPRCMCCSHFLATECTHKNIPLFFARLSLFTLRYVRVSSIWQWHYMSSTVRIHHRITKWKKNEYGGGGEAWKRKLQNLQLLTNITLAYGLYNILVHYVLWAFLRQYKPNKIQIPALIRDAHECMTSMNTRTAHTHNVLPHWKNEKIIRWIHVFAQRGILYESRTLSRIRNTQKKQTTAV